MDLHDLFVLECIRPNEYSTRTSIDRYTHIERRYFIVEQYPREMNYYISEVSI